MFHAHTVLDFWFKEISPELWFKKDLAFDETIRTRFLATWQAATQGELEHWRQSIEGRLAEIIVLDQFSRNLHRNSPLAFAYDSMALVLAQEAVKTPEFLSLSPVQAGFVLMPYMHSESKMIHEIAVPLFQAHATNINYDFELKHKVIIDRFGRYPHRNEILGRLSSEEEKAFLTQEGSSF